MKNVLFAAFAISALALSALPSATAQEKYALQGKYPPGQYEMTVTTDMDMEMEVNGAKMPMKQQQTQYVTIDAGEKNADGTQKLVMEFTRIVINQKAAAFNLKYDSADPESEKSPVKAAGTLVGLKLTSTLDENGSTKKVEGFDEFIEKLTNNPDYPKPVVEMLKKSMNGEMMVKAMNTSREMQPKKPVAVGETWLSEGTMEIPMLGSTKTSTENVLKEVKTEDGKKTAVIAAKAVVRSAEPKELETNGVKLMLSKIEIETDSTILMEVESGLMTSSTAKMTLLMEAEFNAGEQAIKQKTTGNGTTTLTVKKK